MTKRFGRPAPTDPKPATGAIRQINLPREGHALEGAYAEVAAVNAWRSETQQVSGNALILRYLFLWSVVALVAAAVAASIMRT
jgi:hypothetical protein